MSSRIVGGVRSVTRGPGFVSCVGGFVVDYTFGSELIYQRLGGVQLSMVAYTKMTAWSL